MVAHQAVGVDGPAVAVGRRGQDGEEADPVDVVGEDGRPGVAARREMVEGAREVEPQRPCHARVLAGAVNRRLSVGRARRKPGVPRARAQDLTPLSARALCQTRR